MAEKEKNKAKHKVTGLKVNEISFVDNPAVPGAKFVIEKRKGGEGMPETICDACGSEVELEKQELTSKQGEAPINFLQRAVGNLMAVRRSLPRAVRELLMALDMAADDVIQNGSDPDTAKAYIDRAAEGKNEKGKQKECPEGMEFDPDKGECVPKKEEKKEKAGHKEEEEKKSVEKKEDEPVAKKEDEPVAKKEDEPVAKKEDEPVAKKEDEKAEDKSPDPQTGVGGLEFDAEQSAEIVKLLGRYPQ